MSDSRAFYKALAFVLVGTFALILGFNNCAPTSFSQAGSDDSNSILKNPDGDANVDIVQKACQTGTKSKKMTVRFEDPRNTAQPKKTCGWGTNGNGGTENLQQSDQPFEEKFTARTEQNFDFSLPANSKVCDVTFQSSNQRIRYDDHMFLIYDGIVLAATKPIDHLLNKKDGLLQYDWSRLVGQSWKIADSQAYVYCLGMDKGESRCSWPLSEHDGIIELMYQPSLLKRITAQDLARVNHQFKLVTTGDNNPDVDCHHSAIEFEVDVIYSE